MKLIAGSMIIRRVVLGCFFMFLVETIVAQVKATDAIINPDTTEVADKPKLSYFKPKITYLSNSVYSGRKDSTAISYLEPGIEYVDKSGINFSATASYLVSGNVHRFDLFTLGIGYDFNINKKWEVSLFANKEFYNDSSKSVQGGNKGSFGMDMSYDFDILQLGGGAVMMFAETKQFGANLSIAHSIDFGTADTASWSIAPTIKANYGTQGFINQNAKKKAKKRIQTGNANDYIETSIIGGKNTFSILDYDFSLPINFSAKNWGISFTPTYSIPLNAITTVTKTTTYHNSVAVGLPVTSTDKENLSNSLYFEIEAYWRFDLKKK